MPARKSHCDHFAPIFVPRSLTASQIGLGIIFQKHVIIFTKSRFQHFWRNQSLIRPLSLEPRPKMTAIGLSSYQLFAKTLTFDRQQLNCPSVFGIFRKEYVRFYAKVIFLICPLLGHFWRDLFFVVMLLFFEHMLLFLEQHIFPKSLGPLRLPTPPVANPSCCQPLRLPTPPVANPCTGVSSRREAYFWSRSWNSGFVSTGGDFFWKISASSRREPTFGTMRHCRRIPRKRCQQLQLGPPLHTRRGPGWR